MAENCGVCRRVTEGARRATGVTLPHTVIDELMHLNINTKWS